MRVGIAQIKSRLGNVTSNLTEHILLIEKAKAAKVDLIVFPELSLTGYHLLDLTYEVARSTFSKDIRILIELSNDIDIVFGFVENSDQHILYNTAIYAHKNHIHHLHRKVYLPTYGMFDEARYFGAGDRIRSFSTPFGKMGIAFYEDVHHFTTQYLLSQDGAMLIIVPASSPVYGLDEHGVVSSDEWQKLLQVQARIYGVYFIYANRIGTEDGVIFSGNSMIVHPDGSILQKASPLEAKLLIENIDFEVTRRVRLNLPLLRHAKPYTVLKELKYILDKHNNSERIM